MTYQRTIRMCKISDGSEALTVYFEDNFGDSFEDKFADDYSEDDYDLQDIRCF